VVLSHAAAAAPADFRIPLSSPLYKGRPTTSSGRVAAFGAAALMTAFRSAGEPVRPCERVGRGRETRLTGIGGISGMQLRPVPAPIKPPPAARLAGLYGSAKVGVANIRQTGKYRRSPLRFLSAQFAMTRSGHIRQASVPVRRPDGEHDRQ
jgi:hypothetical protein